MTRLDRYILQQLVAAFGFFVLVFTGVIWLTQAVRLIDTVVASGQSAGVFLEFSALVLPQVFVIVLPLAGIGAALYALNRLYTDSELIVMMGAGLGPVSMLRPVALFGVLIGLAMAIVLTVLVPRSGAILAERTRAIRSDLANALIVERQFLHPLPGLTLFITDTSRQGEMAGIFLNDQRDPERPVTYSAQRALLVREGMEARLVMQEGVALTTGVGTAAHLGALRPVRLRPLRAHQRGERARAAAVGIPGAVAPRPHARDAGGRTLRPRRLRLRGPLQDHHAAPRHDLSDDRARHAARRRLPAQRLRQAGGGGDRRGDALAGPRCSPPAPASRSAPSSGRSCTCRRSSASSTSPCCSSGSAASGGRERRHGARGVTLWRYILRGFLRAVLAVFAVIALVIVLFTVVENLRRFGESGATPGDVVRVTLLQAPEVLYQVFPLVLMLASLVTFLRFARTSELVVMRAAGISALRLIAVPVVAALLLGVGFVAVVNPFVAASIKRGQAMVDDFDRDGGSLLAFSPEGVWLRQGDPDGPDGDPGGAHQRRRNAPDRGQDAPLRHRRHALLPHRGAGGAADHRRLDPHRRERVAARRTTAASASPPSRAGGSTCRPR